MFHIKENNERQNKFVQDGIKNWKTISIEGIETIQWYEDKTQLYETIQDYSHIVLDQPYLREEIEFCNSIANSLLGDQTIIYVESNVVVPVKEVSNKEEYSARTIRKKIWTKLSDYCVILEECDEFFGFELQARIEFTEFVKSKLRYYDMKNDPSTNYTSKMSVYLKYGFISPVYIYNVLQTSGDKNKDLYLEELIIRRELGYNFVYYNPLYYSFQSMTYGWAYTTMENHILDERKYLYTIEDYISQKTHDPYFNKAMKNMIEKGYMHGYMRMYWCKKIIEWSANYNQAFTTASTLNNYYFLDGNTPNGYSGIAWCFGKHDRAWGERSIFGKIRYMNQKGLERKFDMKKYL
jgi:deoxyribodipyrimidine photo-lyase